MNREIKRLLQTYDRILSNKKTILGEADISGIDELVYNPATKSDGDIGHGYDNGKRVKGLKWPNHDGHLHIGFTNRQVAMAVIDKANSMGLKTTENPYAKKDPNGKVDNVHTAGSFHYKIFPGEPKVGAGVDISGDKDTVTELIKWVENKYSDGNFTSELEKTTEIGGDEKEIGSYQKQVGTSSSISSQKSSESTPEDKELFRLATGVGKFFGLNEMINTKKHFKKFINEVSSSGNLFAGRSFKWGGGPSAHGSRALGNWQSDNAWDIMAPKGTPVHAIEGGTVSRLGGSPELKKGVIYGYQVTIQSDDNSFFYTHLGERAPGIVVGSKVNKGDIIGYIGAPNEKWPQHVHIGLMKGDIKNYIDKSGNIVGHSGEISTDTETPSIDSPQISSSYPSATKTSSTSTPEDRELYRLATGVGKMFGLNESFGKNIQKGYGTITIPGASNEKIKSPVDGIIDNSKYISGCKNQIVIKFKNSPYLLQYCGITKPLVKNGDSVSYGQVIGKMDKNDSVDVLLLDTSFNRINLDPDVFEKKYQTKDKTEKERIFKKDSDKTYYDAALAAMIIEPFSIFRNKYDKDTGELKTKKWTRKGDADPWIADLIKKPFKKFNKEQDERKEKKISENIERIKKML